MLLLELFVWGLQRLWLRHSSGSWLSAESWCLRLRWLKRFCHVAIWRKQQQLFVLTFVLHNSTETCSFCGCTGALTDSTEARGVVLSRGFSDTVEVRFHIYFFSLPIRLLVPLPSARPLIFSSQQSRVCNVRFCLSHLTFFMVDTWNM